MMKIKYLVLLFTIITSSCINNQLDSNEPEQKIAFRKTLKIILIDASGSFFDIFEKTEDGTISLFKASCEQIINIHLEESQEGERLIVRAITDDGFGHKSVVCDLNFTSEEYCFCMTKPKGAGKLAIWEDELHIFNLKIRRKIDSIKSIEIEKFEAFYKKYSENGGTNKTDLCGTLSNIPIDIEQTDSTFKDLFLYVYSDLRNNTSLERCNEFDGTNLNIEALYVNENGYNPKNYNKFKNNVIIKFFKNAKGVNLFNPTHSQNK